MEVKNRIGLVLTEQNYLNIDLAKELGVTRQTVSNWRRNKIQPPVKMLYRIAKLLNVTVASLLENSTVLPSTLEQKNEDENAWIYS